MLTIVFTGLGYTLTIDASSSFIPKILPEVFKSIGGKVVYFGKPYKEVYKTILKINEKNLVIGDNLNTDIKGANNLKLDSLFISNGVHKEEFNNEKSLFSLCKKYNVKTNFYQKDLTW